MESCSPQKVQKAAHSWTHALIQHVILSYCRLLATKMNKCMLICVFE